MSSFMRRLLAPSEFDILQAKLYASVNHADPEKMLVAVPLVLIVAILLLAMSQRLNLLSLGRDLAVNLGINYRRSVIVVLALISVLMAVSTALVGPMNFYGFLVAALTYQMVDSYDHRYYFAMTIPLAYVIIAAAYFVMNHLFSAQGVVSIIIEFCGGLAYLIILLRRDRQ